MLLRLAIFLIFGRISANVSPSKNPKSFRTDRYFLVKVGDLRH